MPLAKDDLIARDGKRAAQVEAEDDGGVIRPMLLPSKQATGQLPGATKE
jgi:hypothetical protein